MAQMEQRRAETEQGDAHLPCCSMFPRSPPGDGPPQPARRRDATRELVIGASLLAPDLATRRAKPALRVPAKNANPGRIGDLRGSFWNPPPITAAR